MSNEIYHYGVKGMKWGVRRSKEELRYNRNSVYASVNRSIPKIASKNGILVRSFSKHAANQAQERKVSAKDIVDALKKPLYIEPVRIDDYGRKSRRFIGEKATVNVNPDNGNVTTVWNTGSKDRRKYTIERKIQNE